MLRHGYPGGKGQLGTLRRIINEMPPHDHYLEPFLGGGAVMRAKLPGRVTSVGWEVDPVAADAMTRLGYTVRRWDGVRGAAEYVAEIVALGADPERIVCYFDPPYMMATRRSKRAVYHREWTDADHVWFLAAVREFPCVCLVSHYPCALYADALKDWRSFTFTSQTRTGPRVEQLWSNRPAPAVTHDARYLGDNFRERERFKRQHGIIVKRFDALPLPSRLALLSLLEARDIGDAAGRR